jgi:ATP-dependent DNA helicase RecQ
VVYNRLTVERIEEDNKRRYKVDDYEKLNKFYENKIQQIHIVGEYAKKMISDYQDALQFVEDYFQLNNESFLGKYFKGSRQNEIKRNLTPAKFRQLFGELSPTQLKIINDNQSKHIVIAAGPGSGKTKVLVHKLASLLLMEDVKHEQLLMLTFSRAAATEFKKRLLKLIGNAAQFIEIMTFHSYCFDLLGKVGSIEKSDNILKKTIEKINSGDVELSRITKTVLVIDEAQDMDADEFALINAIMDRNEDMRVIAVGDDDQNIYEFRGASSRYLEQFIKEKSAAKYELIENYRSKYNLVEFTNQFAKGISFRLKDIPIIAKQSNNGNIKLIRYQSSNLISPLVQDVIKTGLQGTTCILTRTNDEALLITGLLYKRKRQAKLIQTNDGFNLYNLQEIRFFLSQLNLDEGSYVIGEDIWESAKRKFRNIFQNSAKFEICRNIIKDFEATNPKKKYRSDFEIFIRESKLEDFYTENGEVILVSTIHKSKGKEFDNVFIMLDNFKPDSDEVKRQLYVAMTRAKNNLSIHLNGNYLDHLIASEIERTMDDDHYLPPNEMSQHLNLRDVQLGYFQFVQHRINGLQSGDELNLSSEGCSNQSGDLILKFSAGYQKALVLFSNKGFNPIHAKIDFIIYWKGDDTEVEVKAVLPEIHFIHNSKS